jgi:hypothetical protein
VSQTIQTCLKFKKKINEEGFTKKVSILNEMDDDGVSNDGNNMKILHGKILDQKINVEKLRTGIETFSKNIQNSFQEIRKIKKNIRKCLNYLQDQKIIIFRNWGTH